MKMTMPTPINLPKVTAGVFANAALKGHGKPINNARAGTKIKPVNPYQGAINKMSELAPRKY